jgi:hypothetical protein
MLLTRFNSIHLLISAVIAVSAAASAQEPMLAKGGRAEAAIVIAPDASEFSRWLAGELAGHLKKLSGAELPIVTADKLPAGKPLVVLGGPQANPLAAAADQKQLARFAGLKPDGFVLKRIDLDGVPVLLAGGNDEAATMYAVYELLERLGIVFQIDNDVVPRTRSDLAIPALDVRMEPAVKHRGFYCFHPMSSWAGLDDLKKQIDQAAKMKMNLFQFLCTIDSVWARFSYGGKTSEVTGAGRNPPAFGIYDKDMGYVGWRNFAGTADDVTIGRECFPHRRVCGAEFREVKDVDEATEVARKFLRELISHAHKRKIRFMLLVGCVPFVPLNMVPSDPPGVRLSYEWSGVVSSPGHPAIVDIWEAATRQMIETFPDVDFYGFWGSEFCPAVSDPLSLEVLKRYEALRKELGGPLDFQKAGFREVYGGAQCPVDAKGSDFHVLVTHVASEVIRRIHATNPKANLGLSTLFRSHHLLFMDRVLPPNAWLSNMEWWHLEQLASFQGKPRRDLLLFPRMDDDSAGWHIQLNLPTYERMLSRSLPLGVAGWMGQLTKPRGQECNMRFIADMAWNPTLTAKGFYEGYAARLFGPEAAEPVFKAFLVLQEYELQGRPPLSACGPMRPVHFEVPWQAAMKAKPDLPPSPLTAADLQKAIATQRAQAKRWTDVAAKYQGALALIDQAKPKVPEGAKGELAYLQYKTKTLREFQELTATSHEANALFHEFLLAKVNGETKDALLKPLREAQATFGKSDSMLRDIMKQMIPFADNPTERYWLFRFNKQALPYMERVNQEMAKVVAAHEK